MQGHNHGLRGSRRTGIGASDPSILPVGSVITLTTRDAKYDGVYIVMDTSPKVQGRIVDLYMWSCYEALTFGRQQIEVTVLRLGWNPSASTPSLIDRLFRQREFHHRRRLGLSHHRSIPSRLLHRNPCQHQAVEVACLGSDATARSAD